LGFLALYREQGMGSGAYPANIRQGDKRAARIRAEYSRQGHEAWDQGEKTLFNFFYAIVFFFFTPGLYYAIKNHKIFIC
jgi:hypothetical protein